MAKRKPTFEDLSGVSDVVGGEAPPDVVQTASLVPDPVEQLTERIAAIEARLDALEYRVPGVRRIK